MSIPAFEFLRHESRGSIIEVTLDRPPVNAVNQVMYEEIRHLFGKWNDFFPDSSVAILRGAGRHFCAGNDLDEFLSLNPQNSPGRMKTVREAFNAIYDCPVPVVAAVQGHALGTGLAIVGSCDVVVCSEGARFGCPEIGVGVMGGARHLARLVPQQVVRRMYLTGEPVSAAEIERFGGVAMIVEDGELAERSVQLAEKIARHSKIAVRTAKESLNAIEPMDLKAGYEAEQRYTDRLSGTHDSLEARRAIVDKREPKFQTKVF